MKKFSRRIEDFTCENCGTLVIGNGYTNHCPNCLYSKHVDINPGDRASDCGGLMKPTGYLVKSSGIVIEQTCVICGHVRKNKFSDGDNQKVLHRLSQSSSLTTR